LVSDYNRRNESYLQSLKEVDKLESDYHIQRHLYEQQKLYTGDDRDQLRKNIYEKVDNRLFPLFVNNVVRLNVGGKLFETTLTTLRAFPQSKLAILFSERYPLLKDSKGYYFIDRDGTYFGHVLNFLRRGYLNILDGEIRRQVDIERQYYGLHHPIVNQSNQVLDNQDIYLGNVFDEI